jgi:hypothetical protein
MAFKFCDNNYIVKSGSAVVENLTHHPNVEGSGPAAINGTGRKHGQKGYIICPWNTNWGRGSVQITS